MSEVTHLSQRRGRRGRPPSGGGPNDTDWEGRLRSVEDALTAMETEIPHLATKEDLQKMKVWWLGGIIAGMATAAVIALTFLKIFSS